MKVLRAALLSLLFLSQLPHPAAACENEVQISTSKARQLLLKAEKALAEGKNAEVVDMLSEVAVKDEALFRRLRRVEAVALMRTSALGLGLAILTDLLKTTPDDPYLKTRLAEGLSYQANIQGEHQRALTILEALDRADLIPDAEGDLVLARLRAATNDQAGSEKALARCKKRSSNPARCVLKQ